MPGKKKIFFSIATLFDFFLQETEVDDGSFVSQAAIESPHQEKGGRNQHCLPRPPPISPKIIVRKCQSVTPSSSCENLRRGVTSSRGEAKNCLSITPSSSLEDLPRVTSPKGEKKIEGRSSSENNRGSDKIIGSQQHQPVRRKDLCKLLGLNNDSDIKGVPEGKIAQKVALLHTTKVVNATNNEDQTSNEPSKELEPNKRKNLAKFLGVEALDNSAEVGNNPDRESSKERKNFGKDSLTR
jgi:hypothetical protein